MVLCGSCKNKTSNERCSNNALPGLSLCGKHARVKSPRLWTAINGIDSKVTTISKIWKGYFIRKQLQLAGPGVLNRSVCNNSEELVSLEPITTIHIFDYFGFEENGKIYGFDIRTILDGLHRNLIPTNPYTRQPLSIPVRRRLREIYNYRRRNDIETTYKNNIIKNIDDILLNRWTQICQVAEEHGFFNIHPNFFLSLNKTQLYVLLAMINNDLKTWAAEHEPIHSKRFLYVFWTTTSLKKFSSQTSVTEYSFFVSSVLLSILYNSVEPYTICFIIMSALYRL